MGVETAVGLTVTGRLLVKDVFLTKQTRVDDRSFPEVSHAVTLMLKVDPAAGGTVRVRDPEGGRFVPAVVQNISLSPEYSTLTPDTPALSAADHETTTDWPGETEEYARGALILTDGGDRSVAGVVGTGVVGRGVVAGITGVGIGVGAGVGDPVAV
jgi:hypothetical protein